MGDDDGFDVGPPAFDGFVLGDGVGFFEARFSVFDPGAFLFFGEFDVVGKV